MSINARVINDLRVKAFNVGVVQAEWLQNRSHTQRGSSICPIKVATCNILWFPMLGIS